MKNFATKNLVQVIILTPIAKMLYDLASGSLSDPIAEILNRLGFWTLTLLTLTLACTPAKILFGLTWPNKVRRRLGVTTFIYGSLHFLVYLILDQELVFADIWADLTKRRFITIGFLTLILMLPLAITSTDRMVRRLGYKRWKALHRLVYVAAFTAIIHFIWRVKIDIRRPLIFAAILLVLGAIRFIKPRKPAQKLDAPRTPKSSHSSPAL